MFFIIYLVSFSSGLNMYLFDLVCVFIIFILSGSLLIFELG